MMDFGKLGFGFLRLPQNSDGTVDLETTKKMVDLYLSRGFRYFDTAYIYQNGKNEEYLRQTLVERHPRESFLIADKLPCGYLRSGRTAQEIFEDQLQKCGVEYFDVYLLHGLDGEDAAYAEEMGCFDFLAEQKRLGRVRYTGFSFHDAAEVLDGILTRHPEVDVVQLQLNYLDWDNPIIQSGACWEVCRKHGKPMLVMEPVKGGTLAAIPAEAEALPMAKPRHTGHCALRRAGRGSSPSFRVCPQWRRWKKIPGFSPISGHFPGMKRRFWKRWPGSSGGPWRCPARPAATAGAAVPPGSPFPNFSPSTTSISATAGRPTPPTAIARSIPLRPARAWPAGNANRAAPRS